MTSSPCPRLAGTAAGLALLGAAAALVAASLPPAAAGDAASEWTADAIRARFPDPDAGAAADAFVGNADCKDCHDDRWKTLGTSFHETLRSTKKSGTKGCESCHGPGLVHSDLAGDVVDEAGKPTIRHPGKSGDVASVGACLVCHIEVLEKPVLRHRDWIRGPGGATRKCVYCHDIHVDRAGPAYDPSIGPFKSKKALDAAAALHLSDVAAKAPPLLGGGAVSIDFSARKRELHAKCIGCHPTFHPEMRRSGHADLIRSGEQCGACHGNGALHAESGGDPKKILRPDRLKGAAADETCVECHKKGDVLARWTCSEHSREGVSCVTCHDANAPRGKTLRGSEFDLCGGCHQDVRARMRFPNRHRVAQGRVLCTDCHDPHGNSSKLRDKDLRLRVCADCHAEKTGPFLFDHGIKRTEGCVACHDPHGAPTKRMLSFARIQPMCLQCHPETPHDLSDRTYDNCIACHVEIHGSDLDRNFLR